MATDFRDYFNTRLNQEIERNAQMGISTKYQEVQQAASEKIQALDAGIARAKQRELAAAGSLVGQMGLDSEGAAGTLVNLGASLYSGASRTVGDITSFVAADLEAMVRDASITEPEKQAISRFQQGKATAEDMSLITQRRVNNGYSPLEQHERANAARERGERIDSSFDRSNLVHQGRREALSEQLGADFGSAWDQTTAGAKALWDGGGEGRAAGAADLVTGLARLLYNAGEAALTNPGAASEYVAENIPQLGLGALGQGGRAAMLASNAGYASEQYQKGIAKYQAENGGAYPPEAERMQMAAAAASLALAEQVGDVSLLKGAQGVTDSATTGFKQALLGMAGATARGVGTEAATEGYQTWAEGVANLTPASAQQIYEGAVIGGMAGGGLSGGGRAVFEAARLMSEAGQATARDVAARGLKEAAQAAAITTGDVSALVDPKTELYAPAKAVAALAGHSALPDTPEEVRQANLEQAGQIVAELEDVRDAVWARTPEGIAKRTAEVAEAQAAGHVELGELLQKTIQPEVTDPAEARSVKVELARLDEQLTQARENLTRFTTESQSAPVSDVDSLVASITAPVDETDAAAMATRAKQVDQVINLSMASPERLSPQVAQALAQGKSNGLTEPQRSYLRQFAAARVTENQAKNIGLVQGEVFHGGKGYIGLAEHRSRIATALAAGNQKQADRHLAVLRAFQKDHLAKSAVVADAASKGTGIQVVKVDGKWGLNRGARLSDAEIRKSGGLTVNSDKLAQAIAFEATAITATLKELEAAHALKFNKGGSNVQDVPQAHDATQDAAAADPKAQAARPDAEAAAAGAAEPAAASTGRGSSEVERARVTQKTESTEQTAVEVKKTSAEQSSQSTESTESVASVPLQSTESVSQETQSTEAQAPSESPEETSEDPVDVQSSSEAAASEGRLSAFERAAAGEEGNRVAKSFTQKASKAGDRTQRPLVAVKDFFTHGYTSEKVKGFLGLAAEATLTEEQSRALRAFRQTSKHWFKRVQGNLARKSSPDFFHEDMAQYLVQDVDGKLDLEENVKTAIAYAAFSFVAESAVRPEQNTDDEINAILGREENHPVSEDERAVLSRIGTRQNVVINSLGQRVVDALGLRAGPGASLDLMPRLVASLGAQAWKLLPPELRDSHEIVFFARRPEVLPEVHTAVEAGHARQPHPAGQRPGRG